MSWDIWLFDDRGHLEAEWNLTSNVGCMVSDALDVIGYVLPDDTRPCKWYDRETKTWHDAPNGHGTIHWLEELIKMNGAEGGAYISSILKQLQSDPERYEAMNPENGWGNYGQLCAMLQDMIKSIPEWPCRWEIWI